MSKMVPIRKFPLEDKSNFSVVFLHSINHYGVWNYVSLINRIIKEIFISLK